MVVHDEIELLDVTRAAPVADDDVVFAPAGRRWPVMVFLLIIAFVGWTLARGGDSPNDDAANGDDPVAEGSAGQDSVADGAAAFDDSARAAQAAPSGSVDGAPGDDTDGRSTPSPVVAVLGDGGPLLGDRVGYTVLLGGVELRSLNLDTGELVEIGRPLTEPLLVSGDFVVLRTGDRLATVPLDDLGADPTPIAVPNAGGWAEPISLSHRQDGTLWLRGQPVASGFTLVHYDLATESVIEEVTAPDWTLWGFGQFSGTPDLLGTLTGGVYRRSGVVFKQIGEGQLLAADANRALVRVCDEGLACSYEWRDATSWEPLELAIPEFGVDAAQLLHGTDWLVYFDSLYSENRLFNIVTGASPDLFSNDYWAGVPISPDGRWLAQPLGGDQLLIDDLVDGGRVVIDGMRPNGGSIIFIETPAG